jgi:hypothetical protein
MRPRDELGAQRRERDSPLDRAVRPFLRALGFLSNRASVIHLKEEDILRDPRIALRVEEIAKERQAASHERSDYYPDDPCEAPVYGDRR